MAAKKVEKSALGARATKQSAAPASKSRGQQQAASPKTAGRAATGKIKPVVSKSRPASPAPLARKAPGKKAKPSAAQVGKRVPLSQVAKEPQQLAERPETKARAAKSAKGRGTAEAKSTRVANPKRSTTEQASKRAGARGVDGRRAR